MMIFISAIIIAIFSQQSANFNILKHLLFDSDIEEIPKHVFNDEGGINEHLFTIHIRNFNKPRGSLRILRKNAFYNLKSKWLYFIIFFEYLVLQIDINLIDLSGNQITTIESNAFELKHISNSVLNIILANNYGLTGDSFEDLSFNTGIINTTLFMEHFTNFTILKRNVFHPFLENKPFGKNIINLSGSQLDYYEDNRWLLEYKTTLNLTDKIFGVKMIDGVDLWQSDHTKYNKTRLNVSISTTL